MGSCKEFYIEDYCDLLIKDSWLEKLIESGFCWNGCQTKSKVRISDFLYLVTGVSTNLNKKMNDEVRKILKKRGIKGVNVFSMPEQINWCKCEPRCSQNKKDKKAFFELI